MASAQASPTCAYAADDVAAFFLPPPHWNWTHNSPLTSLLCPQSRSDPPSNFHEDLNSSIPSVVVEETTQYPSLLYAKRSIRARRSSNRRRYVFFFKYFFQYTIKLRRQMSSWVCNSYLWVLEFWVYPTLILAPIAVLSVQWSLRG